MDGFSDRDGKSKSASPENATAWPLPPPTAAEIARRAYELWLEQGKPSGAAERNWLEAEHELTIAAKSLSLIEKVEEQAGSVQR